MKHIEIKAKIQWVMVRDDSTNMWIGICDPLGLTLEGPTYSELMRTIDEVLASLFTDLFREGRLAAFLRAHGWDAAPLPDPNVPEDIGFDVPFFLVPSDANPNPRLNA